MGNEPDRSGTSAGERIPTLVTGLGGLFLAFYVSEQVLFYRDQEVLSSGFLVGFFVSAIFIAALLVGGRWLIRSDLSPERYPRIAKWTIGGLGFYLFVNAPMILLWSSGGFGAQFSWARWAASVGAAGGLTVGLVEARAIQRELEAQRAALRAEQAENQRKYLDYLNGLLRHEVLNTANVITGYASLLLESEDLEEDTETHLETIHRQGRDMTRVIRDVQVLIEATNETTRLRRRDLSDVLEDELDQLRDVYEMVTIESSIPDELPVLADDLLPRVFANLLRNAVEHNDSDHPRLRVTAERDEETVRVRVVDNGPGIPSNERPTLFERSDNSGASHGLGLYLVQTLVKRYGGGVELTETGPEGSVFTVTLPTVEANDTTDDAQGETPPRGIPL